MPNQMIALQARSPQLPDPTRRTAQFVNMMNMARQQEAAQRQAELAQQTMDINKAQEARAAALQGPALTKAQQDNAVQALSMFREAVGDIAEGDVAAAEAVRADLVARVPGYDRFLPPATSWDRDTRNRLMMTAEKEIEKTIATPVASLEVSTAGAPRSVTVGGLRPGQQGVYDVPETPNVAPRATPTAPASQGSTGKFGEATFVPDEAVPLNAYQQEDLRNLQSELGMSNTPASFTRGGAGAVQMTPDVMSRIVDSAFQTGVMAQADFDQLVASQPQQNTQALMDAFRQANITLQADAPSLAASALGQPAPMAANPVQTPQARFADMRGPAPQSQTAGLRGAPPMGQTLAQMRTATPLQQRNPNVSPYPGSAQVPIERVRQEAVAGRETPAEAAARARAVAQANATAETEKKASEKLPGRQQVSTIIKKIRGAYEQLEKQKAIASEKRGGFANIMDYMATTTPGREVQKALGTSASKYLSEITNSRKLLATAIKNATGMSAQEMNSNVELQLTLDALTDPTQGIEAARSTLATLEELYGAPRTAPAQSKRRTSTSTLSAATRAKYGL